MSSFQVAVAHHTWLLILAVWSLDGILYIQSHAVPLHSPACIVDRAGHLDVVLQVS